MNFEALVATDSFYDNGYDNFKQQWKRGTSTSSTVLKTLNSRISSLVNMYGGYKNEWKNLTMSFKRQQGSPPINIFGRLIPSRNPISRNCWVRFQKLSIPLSKVWGTPYFISSSLYKHLVSAVKRSPLDRMLACAKGIVVPSPFKKLSTYSNERRLVPAMKSSPWIAWTGSG